MKLIRIAFAIALPVVSANTIVSLGLSGGFKFPLAWLFTFSTGFITSYISGFLVSRFTHDARKRRFITILIFLLAIFLSLSVGYLTSGSGVLADPTQDPSKGKFLAEQTSFWAIWGSVSGYYLGTGNMLVACLSFGLAIFLLLS
jgi:hypothetical protein